MINIERNKQKDMWPLAVLAEWAEWHLSVNDI